MTPPAKGPVCTGIDGKKSAAGRRPGNICIPAAVEETPQ